MRGEPGPPMRSTRRADLSEGHPNQLTRTAPRQAGVKGAANSCLGLPCKKAPGQGWLFSLVFQTPHFGLQGGVSPQPAPSLEAAFKHAADEQRHQFSGSSLAVSTFTQEMGDSGVFTPRLGELNPQLPGMPQATLVVLPCLERAALL